MTNFDFLTQEEQFKTFAGPAVIAEKAYALDPGLCVSSCRTAMECAIRWMYSVDDSLVQPYENNLATLMSTSEFRDLVKDSIWARLNFIRKLGNSSIHKGTSVTKDQAELCLENLYIFLDFVSFCYSPNYRGGKFDRSLLKNEYVLRKDVPQSVPELETLIKENAALKAELTARREEQQKSYVPKPLEISEYKTRKIYIDTMLQDAGWTEKKDWINEVELYGMPNASGLGYADYVLYGDDGRPLAVVEAKKTCVDVAKGRQQAKLYADILEKKYHRRPVIFLTNGFETRIIDNRYPERQVSFIYSKRDLEKLFNLQSFRTSLKNIIVNRDITDRYYQERAIKAVCKSFDEKNRRKALLVMATGSGKTRTVIELCDVLLQHGWIKHILFLADRNSLVTQAKRSFTNLLPDLYLTNLCEDRDHFDAACVFSTYQTMINCIDTVKDDQGKLFTPGHFDLVICDEAHRSIYNKYRDIFVYFDALLVGLTATPKDDIDKNTYEIFELENGVPTDGYELSQAVKDGYLVDFKSVETQLKFLSDGIVYDNLSEEDKKVYEATFTDEEGNVPDQINASALNEWVFNKATIREVLNTLMTQGQRIDYGENLGKTIIFAKSHNHAEEIYKIFCEEYPHLPGYAKVIDNELGKYAQSAIDEFSTPGKLPQIAISVDMLDTGIDVPEILNLVFFKKVLSKAKFWQMIGRGTRLCPGLLDGQDKKKFLIFDFCGNFEFFRMSSGAAATFTIPLQGAIYHLKAQMVSKLQEVDYQTPELVSFRQVLVDDLLKRTRALNKENFAVRQHLKYVELYSDPESWKILTYENTLMIRQELVPLIEPDNDDPKAVRFDALMNGIELALLAKKTYKRARTELVKKVQGIAKVANIPEIQAQKELIDRILHTDFLDQAGIGDLELIRERLRDLIKYIQKSDLIFITNFDDDILDVSWHDPDYLDEDLKNYREKAAFYIRQHVNDEVITKLHTNIPLTESDIKILETILWKDLGTKEDYEASIGAQPLGEFVRSIVGLDMNAAKTAFAAYLDKTSLDDRQIYFVNQIIEYIVHNGMMKDLSVLQESPFSDYGSVSDVFTDLSVWEGISRVIEQINSNAAVA